MVRRDDIISSIEGLAPLEGAEQWDNCGVHVRGAEEVRRLSVLLDPTLRGIKAAKGEFILSHHPLFFSPIKFLSDDTLEKVRELITRNQTFYAAHTSLDFAPEGVSWALARRLSLSEDADSTPRLRTGTVPCETLDEFIATIGTALGADAIRVVGDGGLPGRVGLIPGSGFHEDVIAECRARGISVLVSGDLKHHAALAAADMGVTLIDAGHRETEMPGIELVAQQLHALHTSLAIDVVEPARPWHYRFHVD